MLRSAYFAIETQLTAVDNRHRKCLRRGTDLMFKYNSGYSQLLNRLSVKFIFVKFCPSRDIW